MLALFERGNAELLVILIVAFLLFGSRLPGAMRSLGRSVTEFKRGMHEVEDEMKNSAQAESGREESQPTKPA